MIGSMTGTGDCLKSASGISTCIINDTCYFARWHVSNYSVSHFSFTDRLQEILSNENIATVYEKSGGEAKTDYAIVKST